MNPSRVALLIAVSLATLGGVACNKAKETPPPAATAPAPVVPTIPEVVSFAKPALYPEGVEYDAVGKRFLVTSLREGVVGEVTDDGKYKALFSDPQMVSAIGLRIDAERDRVLVCNSDPGAGLNSKKKTQGKLAGLGVFQLSTGKAMQYVDLGKVGGAGGHFCNDIAIDKDGTAYVTDSFSPIIYKVDAAYKASVFLKNKRFTGEGFNLNGIVIKDGYLLVAKDNDGSLFKVPMDKPDQFTQVKVQQDITGADGLLWGPDGALILIANAKTNKVFKLTTADNWATATVAASVDTGDVFPTTGVVREGKVFVLYAMLHVLFNPDTKSHVEKFEIHQQKL